MIELSQPRKRIWEVDCLSMDGALAASFCWQEMVNLIQGTQHQIDFSLSESVLEMQVQCLVHRHCHSENEVSLRLERVLNCLHKKEIERLTAMHQDEVIDLFLKQPWSVRIAGLIWALGSDPREGFDCIRRRFHQRIQVMTLRRLIPVEKFS